MQTSIKCVTKRGVFFCKNILLMVFSFFWHSIRDNILCKRLSLSPKKKKKKTVFTKYSFDKCLFFLTFVLKRAQLFPFFMISSFRQKISNRLGGPKNQVILASQIHCQNLLIFTLFY